MDEIKEKLIKLAFARQDCKILKKDGSIIVMKGNWLNIFGDNKVSGKTINGTDVKISLNEIKDVVAV